VGDTNQGVGGSLRLTTPLIQGLSRGEVDQNLITGSAAATLKHNHGDNFGLIVVDFFPDRDPSFFGSEREDTREVAIEKRSIVARHLRGGKHYIATTRVNRGKERACSEDTARTRMSEKRAHPHAPDVFRRRGRCEPATHI
jgi:hypothetical protein